MTLHTFVIPFAVANIKYKILGTPFFEQHVKSVDIKTMPLLFKYPPNSCYHSIPFTAHEEKEYPFFSHIYTISLSKKLFYQPNSSKTVHFSIKSSSS